MVGGPRSRGPIGTAWLRITLLFRSNSLWRSAKWELRDVVPPPRPGVVSVIKVVVIVAQVLMIALVYPWRWPWLAAAKIGPAGHLNDPILVGIWQLEAAVFALVAVFAPLVIETTADPLDRRRMILRYQADVFNWFVGLGLITLLLTGAQVLFLPSDGTVDGRQGVPFWLELSGGVLLIAVGVTIFLTYRLITTTTEQRLEWLSEEALKYMRRALVDQYALTWMQKWANTLLAVNDDSGPFEVKFDVRPAIKAPSDVCLCADSNQPTYVSDISLRRLRQTVLEIAPLCAAGQARVSLTGALHRRIKPGIPIGMIGAPTIGEHGMKSWLARVRNAYFTKSWSPKSFFYRAAFKDLRDKASAAARGGRIGEFELLLQTVTRIAVEYFALAEDAYTRMHERYPLQEKADLSNLEPRTALRAVIHELGEEVLATHSPNVVKAWLHHPHAVLENSRYHPIRNVPAAVYPWFRTANLIRDATADSRDAIPLVTESLHRRLVTYGQDLSAAMLARQETSSDGRSTIEVEAEWYVRVLGKFLSVVDSSERTSLVNNVRKPLDEFPNKNEYPAAVWIECARHTVADCLNARSIGKDPKYGQVEERMNEALGWFDNLAALLGAWRLLKVTEEEDETGVAEVYQQLIDLTWDEQMDLGQGGVIQPTVGPYRGKLGIALLAVELASLVKPRRALYDQIAYLPREDGTALFQLLNQKREKMEEICELAKAIGWKADFRTLEELREYAAHCHLATEATAEVSDGLALSVEFGVCKVVLGHLGFGDDIANVTGELRTMVGGATRLAARTGKWDFCITPANYDEVHKAGSEST